MREERIPKVVLKRRVSHLAEQRHPWLFSGAIERIEGSAAEGDEVAVYTAENRFCGRGLYNPHSQIRVRIYSYEEGETLNDEFWKRRLGNAIDLRCSTLGFDHKEACRLINSEGDNLSGLTVDRYGEYLTIQFTSLALYQRRDIICDYLKKILNPKGIYFRTDKGIRESENLNLNDGLYWGEEPPETFIIEERGKRFLISLETGQKTGFYLDQRDNREAISRYVKDRSVLDLFCYTGGFSVTAALAGAEEVLGIDVSRVAIDLASENARINGVDKRVVFYKGDAFKALTEFAEEGKKFGAIILDPPKFTKSKVAVASAIRGYISLNELAMRCLTNKGILITCSCSGRISRDQFSEIIRIAALQSGCFVTVLEKRGAAPDHPVSITAPETEYLKCYICLIERNEKERE